MEYQVSARKYRPGTFDEVIGQPHVIQTLKNAVNHKRVAHAYVFSGMRGVGKTTVARILAKALNCELGPTSQPCERCPSCEEITKGLVQRNWSRLRLEIGVTAARDFSVGKKKGSVVYVVWNLEPPAFDKADGILQS